MSRQSGYLVCIDFSSGSRRALRTARKLASRAGSSLTVAHVRPFSDVRAAVVEERGDLLKRSRRPLSRAVAEHYRRRLDDWARRSDGERTKLLKGATDHAILGEARRGYDLLVLGSRGRGKVPSFLLGSTVQKVLARSRLPVLVVPPPRG